MSLYKNILFTCCFWLLAVYNIMFKSSERVPYWWDKKLDTRVGLIFIMALVYYNQEEEMVHLKMIEFIGWSFIITKVL